MNLTQYCIPTQECTCSWTKCGPQKLLMWPAKLRAIAIFLKRIFVCIKTNDFICSLWDLSCAPLFQPFHAYLSFYLTSQSFFDISISTYLCCFDSSHFWAFYIRPIWSTFFEFDLIEFDFLAIVGHEQAKQL